MVLGRTATSHTTAGGLESESFFDQVEALETRHGTREAMYTRDQTVSYSCRGARSASETKAAGLEAWKPGPISSGISGEQARSENGELTTPCHPTAFYTNAWPICHARDPSLANSEISPLQETKSSSKAPTLPRRNLRPPMPTCLARGSATYPQ